MWKRLQGSSMPRARCVPALRLWRQPTCRLLPPSGFVPAPLPVTVLRAKTDAFSSCPYDGTKIIATPRAPPALEALACRFSSVRCPVSRTSEEGDIRAGRHPHRLADRVASRDVFRSVRFDCDVFESQPTQHIADVRGEAALSCESDGYLGGRQGTGTVVQQDFDLVGGRKAVVEKLLRESAQHSFAAQVTASHTASASACSLLRPSPARATKPVARPQTASVTQNRPVIALVPNSGINTKTVTSVPSTLPIVETA